MTDWLLRAVVCSAPNVIARDDCVRIRNEVSLFCLSAGLFLRINVERFLTSFSLSAFSVGVVGTIAGRFHFIQAGRTAGPGFWLPEASPDWPAPVSLLRRGSVGTPPRLGFEAPGSFSAMVVVEKVKGYRCV